jgi:two-component system sensor histidine kinase MprB
VAVGLAIALGCTLAYVVVRSELRAQVDAQLEGQVALARRLNPAVIARRLNGSVRLPDLSPLEGGPIPYVQVLDRDGTPLDSGRSGYRVPVDATDRRLARERGRALRDVRDGEVHLRLLTIGVPGGGAIQLARPLNNVDDVLARLRLILALVSVAGIAVAAVVGRLLTRRLTAPLREVAEAAAHIADTRDLTRRIDVDGTDEVGQLAARFNEMLDRLEASQAELHASVAAQRQLVADASHELRTPITAVRTNIEVLQAGDRVGPATREALMADVVEQTDELAGLIGDIIELARGDEQLAVPEEIRLDALVTEEVARARRLRPSARIELHATPARLDGTPDRLARAVSNLLDNAAKHSELVEVSVDPSGVTVRDHGPGLSPEDLAHMFDRFYRGTTARAVPGTGLGLAIVRQVAEAHGGAVGADNAPGGGAVLRLELPATALASG